MRNKLKKTALLLSFLSILTMGKMWHSQPVFAQNDPPIESQLEPEDVTARTFRELNPLYIANSPHRVQLSTPRGIISRILTFAFPLAGIILFVMIVWGGFEMISGAATKKSLDAGRQRVTAAIIGFLLLFVSYWIMQVVEVVFGVRIL